MMRNGASTGLRQDFDRLSLTLRLGFSSFLELVIRYFIIFTP